VWNLRKHIDKIYCKPSLELEIVENLGEDSLPETEAQPTSVNATDKYVPAQSPPASEPVAPETATPHSSTETSNTEKQLTTEKCKPVKVSDITHLRITPENLKDYVGLPVCHQDRMYVRSPPAGVSTGLGYLANSPGVVMPIGGAAAGMVAPGSRAFINVRDRGTALQWVMRASRKSVLRGVRRRRQVSVYEVKKASLKVLLVKMPL